MSDYIVIVGRTTVETSVGPGRARVDVHRGQRLPADVSGPERDHLLRLGHVEIVGGEPLEEAEPDGPGVDLDGDGVPEGAAHQVIEWVAGDLDRARAALDAETAKGDQARKGLTADLQKILDA